MSSYPWSMFPVLTCSRMLVPEECPNDNLTFMRQLDIRLFQVRIPGNKDTANISADNVTTALSIILDRDNYPILIHCNKGKVRLLLGCSPSVSSQLTNSV